VNYSTKRWVVRASAGEDEVLVILLSWVVLVGQELKGLLEIASLAQGLNQVVVVVVDGGGW